MYKECLNFETSCENSVPADRIDCYPLGPWQVRIHNKTVHVVQCIIICRWLYPNLFVYRIRPVQIVGQSIVRNPCTWWYPIMDEVEFQQGVLERCVEIDAHKQSIRVAIRNENPVNVKVIACFIWARSM